MGSTCLLIKNTSDEPIDLEYFRAAKLIYQSPWYDGNSLNRIGPEQVVLSFSSTDRYACCRISEIQRDFGCYGIQEIPPGELFILGFNGTMKTANGKLTFLKYQDVKGDRGIFEISYESGYTIGYQVV